MSMIPIPYTDGSGAVRAVAAVQIGSNISFVSTPEIGGVLVSTSAPMPVTDAAAEASLSTIAAQGTLSATALGTPADAVYVSGSGSAISVLKGIFGKFGSFVLGAGSALIGKVGIDQTTPGTTNNVTLSDASGHAVIATAGGALTVVNAAGSAAIGTVGVTGRVTTSGTQPVSASAAPAVTVGSYAVGVCVGGLVTVTGLFPNGAGLLNKILGVINGNGTFSSNIQFFVFNALPSSSTITDHATMVIAAADWPKIVGAGILSGATATGTANLPFVTESNTVFQPISLTVGTFYVAFSVQASTGSFATTSDLNLQFEGVAY
jgi:hypothetical protein